MGTKGRRFAAWAVASTLALAGTALAAPPSYTLVKADRGDLRPLWCPVMNDSNEVAFTFRDVNIGQDPANGIAFWSEAKGLHGVVQVDRARSLYNVVGLTGSGVAVAALGYSTVPDATGMLFAQSDGITWTRPPGWTVSTQVVPKTVTEGGSVLIEERGYGINGWVYQADGNVLHRPISPLLILVDINDTGAGIGLQMVNSEKSTVSAYVSYSGEAFRLAFLPGVDSRRAATQANAINNHDAIVGVTHYNKGYSRATLWDSPHAVPRVLPGTEDLSCTAYSINDRNEVVGKCSHGLFYWSAEQGLVLLRDLLPPDAVAAGAKVREGTCAAINNQGVILLTLKDPGAGQGVPALLKPNP